MIESDRSNVAKSRRYVPVIPALSTSLVERSKQLERPRFNSARKLHLYLAANAITHAIGGTVTRTGFNKGAGPGKMRPDSHIFRQRIDPADLKLATKAQTILCAINQRRIHRSTFSPSCTTLPCNQAHINAGTFVFDWASLAGDPELTGKTLPPNLNLRNEVI